MPSDTPQDQSVLDQVISLDKQDKADTPISAVAAVLKQRDELKKQIESKIAEDSSVEKSEPASTSSDAGDAGSDDDMDFGDMDDEDDSSDEDDKSDDTEEKDESDKDDEKDSQDKEKAKADKEDADRKKAEEADKKDEGQELDKQATESLTLIRRDASGDYFKGVKLQHAGYLQHTKAFSGLAKHARLSLEEHPIVYTKEKVLESLKGVVGTVAIYSKSIAQVFNTMGSTLKGYVEQVTYYDEYAKSDRTSFTNKLEEDKDVLLALAIASDVDIKASLRSLYKYNTAISTLSKTVLSNGVETLPGSFQTSGFSKDEQGTEFAYHDKLPGFTTVKANAAPYENYLRTKVDQYNVFSLNVSKTIDYYNTSPIGMDKVEELKTIVDYSFKLIASLALVADNMKALDTALQATLDKVKVKIYDVENNKVQDLASLGLDEVLHDVIKLKLVIEASLVTVKLNNKFLVSLFRFLKTTVKLK